METKAHIVVVDDDDRLRTLLGRFLHEQGFMVSLCASAAKARAVMQWLKPDIVVLDVMMPGETGLEFLRTLPAQARPPVLMLSAMGETDDRIKGLELGADDYLPKPFEPKELVLRLKTILRRQSSTAAISQQPVVFGDYVFDRALHQLKRADELVSLTPSETSMLALLAQRAGTPVSREELSALIPGGSSERSVDVQITRLRKKIEAEGKPRYLQTVRGAGYVLYAHIPGEGDAQ